MTEVWTAVVGTTIVLLLGSAVSVSAQEAAAAADRPAPHVEIGAVVSGIFASGTLPGFGVRVGGGDGGRFSVEGELDWAGPLESERTPDQLEWFFLWQVKQRVSPQGRRPDVFLTYGTAGWSMWQSVPPGRLEQSLLPPILPIVGFAFQHFVARRLAIRGDGQLLLGPFEGAVALPRISVGISIPIRPDEAHRRYNSNR